MGSCKKDKLEGDAEILIGYWKWINTQALTNTCEADSLWSYSYLDSSVSSNEFSIEFFKKGKVYFIHNDGIIWKERIVFKSIEAIVTESYLFEFNIYLDNNKNDILHGFVGEDSLLLDDFPLDKDNSCENRRNHFIRE